MLPPAIARAIEEQVNGRVTGFRNATGGCVNACAIINANRGNYFVKWNTAALYPGMFEAEMHGLKVLRATGTVHAPEPHFTGTGDGWSWIVMEAVLPGTRRKDYWERFGQDLAALHRQCADQFGFSDNNYIGSLPQVNDFRSEWYTFYVAQRLQPLVRSALDRGLLDAADARHFECLCGRLEAVFPTESPALLHGDLWGGNFLTGPDGNAWVIDPAVYYGHREMDLAMAFLFGGFDRRFYDAYREAHPLEAGWEKRVELAQLYPLLVHVNLFGTGYVGSVREIVKRFGC